MERHCARCDEIIKGKTDFPTLCEKCSIKFGEICETLNSEDVEYEISAYEEFVKEKQDRKEKVLFT